MDKLGVYLNSIIPAAGNDYRKAMEKIAELGFKSLQFAHYNSAGFSGLEARVKKELLTEIPGKLGLTVSGIGCNISSIKTGTVRERMAVLCEAMDFAAACQVPCVIIHGGEAVLDDEEVNREAWQRLLENLKYGTGYAQDRGVVLAQEPGGPLWMVHGWKILLRLRDEIGALFKVNYDPANVYMTGQDPVAGVYALKDTIYQSHLKDARLQKKAENLAAYNRKIDEVKDEIPFQEWRQAVLADCEGKINYWCETPLGQGDIDFTALLKAFRETGFNGYFAIEREGGDNRIGDLAGARTHLEKCSGSAN